MTLLRKTSGPDSDTSVMGAGKAETRWQMVYSRTDSAPSGWSWARRDSCALQGEADLTFECHLNSLWDGGLSALSLSKL
jgi:hypothetical protein